MKFKLLEPLIIFVFRTTFVVQMLKGKRQAEKKNRTPQLQKCSAELSKRQAGTLQNNCQSLKVLIWMTFGSVDLPVKLLKRQHSFNIT